MANVIIVTLIALFFLCAFYFGPKKTAFKTYYALKYVLFKPIEWLIRLIIALLQINVYVWCCLILAEFLAELIVPKQDFGQVMVLLIIIYVWLVLMLVIRNLRDEDDRDFVRMMLAQLEHKLCFHNRNLSMYPHDWHWFD